MRLQREEQRVASSTNVRHGEKTNRIGLDRITILIFVFVRTAARFDCKLRTYFRLFRGLTDRTELIIDVRRTLDTTFAEISPKNPVQKTIER